RLRALEIFSAGHVDERDNSGCNSSQYQCGLEMMPAYHSGRKRPDGPLVAGDIRRQLQPVDWSFGGQGGRTRWIGWGRRVGLGDARAPRAREKDQQKSKKEFHSWITFGRSGKNSTSLNDFFESRSR